jgi:two-component system chemotaxis sensor kinase CheA
MLIQDQTLRALFKTESDEHLQRLDEILLRLEHAPEVRDLIEEAFREAHSMKGAARMLGLKAILSLVSRLEGSLNLARQGAVVLDRDAVTQMLREIGQIRFHVHEATGEAPMPVAVVPEIAPSPAPAVVAPRPDAPQVQPALALPEAVPPAPTYVATGGAIETVRVDTRKLDELMTHAGEIVVMRTRFSQRLAEMDALLEEFGNAVRSVSQGDTVRFGACLQSLGELRRTYADDGARLDTLSSTLESTVQKMRLLPFSTVLKMFPRMVRELAVEQAKDIELRIEGDDTLADRRILEEIKDPVMHLLRNAIDHGIEAPARRITAGKLPAGRVTISASHTVDSVVVVVSDDGNGLDLDSIRATARQRGLATDEALAALSKEQLQALILVPGFSTKRFVTDVSGRGVGMDVVRANIVRLRGSLDIASTPGSGTSFTIRLPNTLATVRALLIDVGGLRFGLPLDAVGVSRAVTRESVFTREGRHVVLYRGTPVPVARLADLLGLPAVPAPAASAASVTTPCVFLTVGKSSFGVFVDALVDEQHLVLKPLSPLLGSVRCLQGSAILSNGAICTVLDPGGLYAALPGGNSVAPAPRNDAMPADRKKLILLAEDSITTRAQEVRILEGAGYEVVAATDGLDAYGKLGTRHFDAVISDINMPRLDGLQLAEKIRAIPEYADLPVILVTSLASDDDKRRGLEIGANAYITKPEFDQSILLDCLERLVG